MGNKIFSLLLLGSVVAIVIFSALEDPANDVLSGHPADAFSVPVLGANQTTGPQDHQGSVVLIDFWATHCGPCVESMPGIQRIYETYDPSDFTLLSVNVDPDIPGTDRVGLVSSFSQHMDLQFPILMDYGSASRAYGVEFIPMFVVVDRDGIVRYVHRGPASERQLQEEIEELL